MSRATLSLSMWSTSGPVRRRQLSPSCLFIARMRWNSAAFFGRVGIFAASFSSHRSSPLRPMPRGSKPMMSKRSLMLLG